jgi:dTDP-4-amino-4,6-dideoxygalactose transaminase
VPTDFLRLVSCDFTFRFGFADISFHFMDDAADVALTILACGGVLAWCAFLILVATPAALLFLSGGTAAATTSPPPQPSLPVPRPHARQAWVVAKPLRGDRALELLQRASAASAAAGANPCVRATEAALHAHMRLGADYVLTLAASGTAALRTLVAAYGAARGAPLRVVTQASTFDVLCAATLVVDNDLELRGPCIVALERHVDDFDAVLLTHFFGVASSLDAYARWCASHGKLLLCDAATTPMAFGADGRNACELGDGAVISCHETKPLGRGEGGAIVMRRDCVAFPYLRRVLASHGRMSDIAAAFLAARLETLTEAVYARAHANVCAIDAALQHPDVAPHVRWAAAPPTLRGSTVLLSCLWLWTTTPVDDLDAFCAAHSIEARRHYAPLTNAATAPRAATWCRHSVKLPFLYDCGDVDEVTRGVYALAAWVAASNAPRV